MKSDDYEKIYERLTQKLVSTHHNKIRCQRCGSLANVKLIHISNMKGGVKHVESANLCKTCRIKAKKKSGKKNHA